MYKFTVIRFVIIHTVHAVTSVGTLNKMFSPLVHNFHLPYMAGPVPIS